MRIASLEVIPIALPFQETYRTASGTIDARAMAIVRLQTASGFTGLGEAVPLSLRGGPGIEQVTTELRDLQPVLEGADASIAAGGDTSVIAGWIDQQLERGLGRGAGPQALCGVDQALHDLAGKVAGLPAWRLLGAEEAAPVECNASIAALDPGAAAESAARDLERGFRTFKVKVGSGDDGARIAAVRESVGSGPKVRIDANGSWSVPEADRRIAELDRVGGGLELAEQPCASLPELKELREASSVPIVADESVSSLGEARRMAGDDACDAATLKLAKVGGPRAALRIAREVPSYLSSALDGQLGIAAGLHVAQALPRTGFAAGLAQGLATLGMFAASYADPVGLVGASLMPLMHRASAWRSTKRVCGTWSSGDRRPQPEHGAGLGALRRTVPIRRAACGPQPGVAVHPRGAGAGSGAGHGPHGGA
jgi:L-alanine-DL-glutamate epimerase-like enolase superfamily enzyme